MAHQNKKSTHEGAFFVLRRRDEKDERHRETVRGTVSTASDQAAQFAARIESLMAHQKAKSRARKRAAFCFLIAILSEEAFLLRSTQKDKALRDRSSKTIPFAQRSGSESLMAHQNKKHL